MQNPHYYIDYNADLLPVINIVEPEKAEEDTELPDQPTQKLIDEQQEQAE